VSALINQLRQLVSRYVAGSIGYEPFRHEFVSRFLAASDADILVKRLYNAIESACSARDHNYIDEPGLKTALSELAKPIIVVQVGDVFDVVLHASNVNRVASVRQAGNGLENSFVSYAAGNSAPILSEPEFEEEAV
jgi:hypothetical protein